MTGKLLHAANIQASKIQGHKTSIPGTTQSQDRKLNNFYNVLLKDAFIIIQFVSGTTENK